MPAPEWYEAPEWYKRFIRRSTKGSLLGLVALSLFFACASVADLLGAIDWGFGLAELLASVGFVFFAGLLYLLARLIFRFIGFGKF